MKAKILGLLAVGLVSGPLSAHALIIGGKHWRQPAEINGFNWIEINNVCGSGYCSGGTGDLATLNGWYWATNADLQALFEELILPGTIQFPTSTFVYGDIESADIDAAIGPGAFAPTLMIECCEFVEGWSRDQFPDAEGFAYAPYLVNAYAPGAIDNATLAGGASFDSILSVWLYRPVPEPGSLALLGLGLLGLGLTRRRTHGGPQ